MCIRGRRLCPGCKTETPYSELTKCDKACRRPNTFELALRHEHFSDWNCPTDLCLFNTKCLQNLERNYVLELAAQSGGDASALTADGKLAPAYYHLALRKC
jgi:hypothetical protein